MNALGISRFCVLLLLSVFLLGSYAAAFDSWYSGTWDSSIYNRSEKPRTVGLRIEVIDKETGIAVRGARVTLKGGWLEERIGTAGDEVGIPYEPQEREFEMTGVSEHDGVVVFALSWEKEYPWRFGRPEPKVDKRGNVTFYDVHTSWKRAVDDIEKVRAIEIRHSDYRFTQLPLDFNHLTEFGQNRRSESQEPRLFDAFEKAWHREMKRPGVKFCVLDLGTDFGDFGNKRSSRREFFAKVRDKDFGTVYSEPSNWFSVGKYPQSECGPYFVYSIEIPIERRSGQVDVHIKADRFDDFAERDREEERRQAEREREMEREKRRRELERKKQRRLLAEERARREGAERIARERKMREEDIKKSKENRSGVATRDYDKKKREEVNRAMGMPMGIIGAVVSYVDPNSAAYKAGLREGMIVTSVEWRHSKGTSNITPTSAEYFDKIMKNRKPGEKIELDVWYKSEGNRIKKGYAGSEQKGKWYRKTLRFTMD